MSTSGRVAWSGCLLTGVLLGMGGAMPPAQDEPGAWSDQQLLEALTKEESRTKAAMELRKRGEKNRPPLLELVKDGSKPRGLRLTALDVALEFWNKEVQETVVEFLEHSDPEFRAKACFSLAEKSPGDKTAQETLLPLIQDPESRVRAAACLALGTVNAPGAADHLVQALAFDDGKDKALRLAIVRAIERTGKSGVEKLLIMGESGDDSQLALLIEAYPGLRGHEAAVNMPRLLKNYHVKLAQQANLLRVYAHYPPLDPKKDFSALKEYAASLPGLDPGGQERDDQVRVHVSALEVLAKTGVWKTDEVAQKVKALILADPKVIAALAKERVTAALPALTGLLDQGVGDQDKAAVVQAKNSLEGVATQCWVVGPILPEFQNDPPKSPAPLIQGDTKLTWRKLTAGPFGRLNLRGEFPKVDGPVFSLVYVHSPRDQKANLQVEGQESLKVWLDGKPVCEPKAGEPGNAEVALAKGWSVVVIRTSASALDFGFSLRCEGRGLRLSLGRD